MGLTRLLIWTKGEFRRQLAFKALERGKTIILPAHIKTCSARGHKVAQMPLSIRSWTVGQKPQEGGTMKEEGGD